MEDEDAAPPALANNLSPIYAGGQWHYPRDADEAAEMQMQAADEEEAANGPQLAGGSPPIETVDICDSQVDDVVNVCDSQVDDFPVANDDDTDDDDVEEISPPPQPLMARLAARAASTSTAAPPPAAASSEVCLLVDERERERNSRPLGIYLDLHKSVESLPAMPNRCELSVDRQTLSLGDFAWSGENGRCSISSSSGSASATSSAAPRKATISSSYGACSARR